MVIPIKEEELEEKTTDEATKPLIKRTEELEVPSVYHRFNMMQPQCEAGLKGICCSNCMIGPCKLDPAAGVNRTICGCPPDTVVARNLVRHIAAGCSTHADHAFETVETLHLIGEEEDIPYEIADVKKLQAVAKKLGIKTEGKEKTELAKEIAEKAFEDYGNPTAETLNFVRAYEGKERKKVFEDLGILPRSLWRESTESLHRTHTGVDSDPVNLLLHGLRTGLADAYSMLIATEIQDILFGTPKPVKSEANLGVLDPEQVNLVVHGHNPLLSWKVTEVAESEEMISLAKDAGAKGINVVGMCCTGNEILMRQGIPTAGNLLHQEFALATGAVDVMCVDYQCVFPAIVDFADCFHTDIVTTMPKAKIPGAVHIEWSPEKADKVAKKIVKRAVETYKNRDEDRIYIPDVKSEGVVGFSVEAILEALGGSLDPLLDAVKEGDIYGIVGIVGCNNPKVPQDSGHIGLAKELIKNNVLVVGTGCWSVASLKNGLMSLDAQEMAGERLKGVLKKLEIPPVLHMGSCVDNSRITNTLTAIADALDVDIPDLPVYGSAPEAMSEKAIAIATGFIAHGVNVHLGVTPPVTGGKNVLEILTDGLTEYTGSKFVVESDPKKAADIILDHIEEKREELDLPT